MTLREPPSDPAPVFDLFRGNFATELLTAAVAHLGVFGRLARGPLRVEELGAALGLARRPMVVLTTALRAMGLLDVDADGRLELTPLARTHLVPGSPFDVGDYVGLMAESPGVRAMVERLRTNRPAGGDGAGPGVAYIYRDGVVSAMDDAAAARHLTLALASRARNVAPALARARPLDGVRRLLDVGGGSGLYAIAYLERHPGLEAVVWDRAEVLKVASELAREHGVADRLRCVAGDMFADPVPEGCDAILLSNVLHDWDEPDGARLVGRLAEALPPGGRLLIHDVFLDDDLGGPLELALYSAALFSLTEGRAYSAGEYRAWLRGAGLTPGDRVVPTLARCGVVEGRRRA